MTFDLIIQVLTKVFHCVCYANRFVSVKCNPLPCLIQTYPTILHTLYYSKACVLQEYISNQLVFIELMNANCVFAIRSKHLVILNLMSLGNVEYYMIIAKSDVLTLPLQNTCVMYGDEFFTLFLETRQLFR